MGKWKQKKGNEATYINLIEVFECAGNRQYADYVRRVAREKTGAQGGHGHQEEGITVEPPLSGLLPYGHPSISTGPLLAAGF